jgi:CHAT domain-containing protein
MPIARHGLCGRNEAPKARCENPPLFRAIDLLYWQLLQGGDDFDYPFAHPYHWGAFIASGAV